MTDHTTDLVPTSDIDDEIALARASLDDAYDRARDLAETATSESTRRAYRSDFAHFVSWCDAHRVSSLPASVETVVAYMGACEGVLRPATIRRRLTSIAVAHKFAKVETPTKAPEIELVWQGIVRKHTLDQDRATPLLVPHLQAIVAVLGSSLVAKRDRALLLVGFAGAFRRAELVAIDVEDLRFFPEGVVVHLRRSKTDQEGKGADVAIQRGSYGETCPVRALQAWLKAGAIVEGPVFRGVTRHGRVGAARLSDRAVDLVVKRSAEAAGLQGDQWSGHSLRAGLATQAAAAGFSDHQIMRQTRHKSAAVLARYVRFGRLFKDNVTAGLGL